MIRLKIFNSLTNKKEEFIPIDSSNIRLYVCGPTVYDYAHIGNARMAVVFDFLVRLLRTCYPKVTYVSNITDIDDKIIIRSIKEDVPYLDITKKFTQIYNEDMDKLNVMKPDLQPRASEYVEKMIVKIEELLKKKVAYHNDGHILFDVSSFPKYGLLSNRSKEEQIPGSRIKVEKYKNNPEDFVLWKPSVEKEPGWKSPWGYGRPGWHTECFVMSEEILKTPFDIHGGGLDLKFPHHENEIAQSCCFSNNLENINSYARYWVHNGFVNIDKEKMSKSKGNIRLVKDYLKSYDGEIIRLALLSSHYRSPLNWSKKILEQSKNVLNKFYIFLRDTENLKINDNDDINIDTELKEALLDDLNLAKAFSHLNKIIANRKNLKDSKENIIIRKNIKGFGKILGIFQKSPKDWFKRNEKYSNIKDKNIKEMIEKRNKARNEKNYKLADDIRRQLEDMGLEIKDDVIKTPLKEKK